jgi:hypothetical protein
LTSTTASSGLSPSFDVFSFSVCSIGRTRIDTEQRRLQMVEDDKDEDKGGRGKEEEEEGEEEEELELELELAKGVPG